MRETIGFRDCVKTLERSARIREWLNEEEFGKEESS